MTDTPAPDGQSRMSGVVSASKNSAYLLAIQFTSIVMRLAYLTVLARAVMPEDYGILTYTLSWYLVLLPFTFLGADVVLGREISRRREAASDLLGVTLGSRAICVAVVLAASIILAFVVEPNAKVRSLIIVFSLALPGRSLWMWTAAVFTAFEKPQFLFRFELAARLLELASILLVLYSVGPDLLLIAMIHAVSWLLQGVAATWSVRRRFGISLSWPSHDWLAAARAGIPGANFSIAMAAFFQLPIVLFRQFQGTGDELGFFALAFQIVTYLLTIPYVVANASLPVLARSAQRQDGKDRTAVLILAFLIVIGGAAVAIAAGIVANPIVTLLFGEHYSAAATVLQSAIWLVIPASLAMLLQQMLFSYAVTNRFAAAGPLLGVVIMALLYPVLQFSSADGGALAAVAIGFLAWLAFALAETVRMGFFKRQKKSIDVDGTC